MSALLNEKSLTQQLKSKGLQTPFRLHLLSSVDSTNRYLRDVVPQAPLEICCAEMQTQGRGRFGRHWYSPFGENIYCSLRWRLSTVRDKLSGLSLVTSLAIKKTLSSLDLDHVDLQIKWPNDLLWQGKKLSGNLIELLGEEADGIVLIIGIGINVNTDPNTNPFPNQAWCSLYEIFKQPVDRNVLIAALIAQLEHYLYQFLEEGFSGFIAEWDQFDYLFGKSICLTQFSKQISGIAKGVNQLGELILEDKEGRRSFFSSGESSLN